MSLTSSVNLDWIKTTCAYCGVGCGIEAKAEEVSPGGEIIVKVRGDEDHPANFGRLCSKGLALGETAISDGRLLKPSINNADCTWDQALDHVADKFKNIIAEHGPDAVAFYVSGQLLTEDYYIANKLMKGFIGTANIDTNSRLCMSSSVAGHKRAFGSDTVPGVYTDFELSDLVILVGSNLAWCHPVLFQRLKEAKAQRPEMKVVVVDPRATDTCAIADLHLKLQPGTDVALFNGLLVELAEKNCLDSTYIDSFTEGFESALTSARNEFSSQQARSEALGIPLNDLQQFYDWVCATEKTLTVYSQGVNQSSAGVDKVNAIINTHFATGRIGKPGCGPFSITGQPNAMGGREVGGLANTLAAHLEFNDETAYKIVSEFWQTDRLAQKPGLRAVELFDAIDEGKVKAVWVMATNPVVSLPNANKVISALQKCELVVVSDCIEHTDTAEYAHVKLPAQGWSEKSGTVTNSERRISRQRNILPPKGEAKPDWWIMSEVGKRLGFESAFSYNNEAEIFQEHAQLTAFKNNGSRDLNLAGLSSLNLEKYNQLSPVQWPCDSQEKIAEQNADSAPIRLFSKGGFFTPSGRGQFIAVEQKAPKTKTSKEYPLVLNTGRIRDQWHTMTRTGLASRLGAHKPEPFLSIHPQSAASINAKKGDIIEITSRCGSALARVNITTDVSPTQVFMPIHWTNMTSSAGRVGVVVTPEYDDISGQPEAKFTPVNIKKHDVNAEAMVVSRDNLDLPSSIYWARQTINNGYLYYLATQDSPQQLKQIIDTALPQEADVNKLQFNDSGSNGGSRFARIRAEQILDCAIVAESLAEQDYSWLGELLSSKSDIEAKRSILSGTPSGRLATGKLICACKQIGVKTIQSAIDSKNLSTVKEVSLATTAGTGCGTCMSEIEQILKETLSA